MYPLSVRDSFYYKIPCIFVVEATLTRVCLVQLAGEEVEAGIDGFVRPYLLDRLALPHFVTPTISLYRVKRNT